MPRNNMEYRRLTDCSAATISTGLVFKEEACQFLEDIMEKIGEEKMKNIFILPKTLSLLMKAWVDYPEMQSQFFSWVIVRCKKMDVKLEETPIKIVQSENKLEIELY